MVQDIQTVTLDKDTILDIAFEAYKSRTDKAINGNFTSVDMVFDKESYSLTVKFATNYND